MSEKNGYYKKQILKHLYFGHTLSCTDLSEKLEKSLPLTTKLLQELIKDSYINETGFAPSSGGRRPVTYSLKKDMLYIIAIAMDQFVVRIVVMDMHNHYIT